MMRHLKVLCDKVLDSVGVSHAPGTHKYDRFMRAMKNLLDIYGQHGYHEDVVDIFENLYFKIINKCIEHPGTLNTVRISSILILSFKKTLFATPL